MLINQIIAIPIVILATIVAFKLIASLSKTAFKVAAHILTGWILLGVVNFLLGIHIPINLITMLISGFGGAAGTLLLTIFYIFF